MQAQSARSGAIYSTLAVFSLAWRQRRPYQTFSWILGALVLMSGILHFAVFLVDGGSWNGPVSWRKPVTFGLSFGLTTVTLTWIAGMLRHRGGLAVATVVVAVTSALEVFFVGLQKWREVPSHFNDSTVFDSSVFSLMGLTVAVLGIAIVAIAIYAMKPFDSDPPMRVAVRVGMVVLIASQILGGAIIANGEIIDKDPLETDLAIFGAAGVMKLPHAVTMHAIQVLPILALLLATTSLPVRKRRNIVWVAAAGYTGLILAALLQTFAGRSPVDLTPLALGVVVASAVMGGIAILGLAAGMFGSKPGDAAV
jgi:hypothetical protein